VGSFRSSACRLEEELLKKLGIHTWYTPRNRVIRGILGSAVWALTLAKISKSKLAIPLFYFQGMVSALLLSLEVVNYIEHFGLERKFDPGKGERAVMAPQLTRLPRL